MGSVGELTLWLRSLLSVDSNTLFSAGTLCRQKLAFSLLRAGFSLTAKGRGQGQAQEIGVGSTSPTPVGSAACPQAISPLVLAQCFCWLEKNPKKSLLVSLFALGFLPSAVLPALKLVSAAFLSSNSSRNCHKYFNWMVYINALFLFFYYILSYSPFWILFYLFSFPLFWKNVI